MKKVRRLAALLVAFALLFTFIPAPAQSALAFDSLPDLIRPGKLVLLSFTSPSQGSAEVSLLKDSAVVAVIAKDFSTDAGLNDFSWDGLADGQPVAAGSYTLAVRLGDDMATAPLIIGDISPVLDPVLPSDTSLHPGAGWSVQVTANMPGTLTMGLEGQDAPLYQAQVPAGETEIPWDGTAQGAALAPETYTLVFQLTDETGFASNAYSIPITIEAAPAEPESTSAVAPVDFSPYPAVDGEKDYWTLPMDITDEAAIWNVLMQPITVLDGNEKLAYKLRAEPSNDAKAVGEVTYSSQGVRVLKTLDNGWSLVEAYSSSFKGSTVKAWAEMVQGYVKTSLLKTKKPSQKYGLILDKLTQRMYVFADGKLFTELLISTGLISDPNKPYTETQAGEYLLVSWVGQFHSDNLLCDMAIRFNNGNLIHQVPYTLRADGSKYFDKTEPKLGTKASHGCVRVQRRKNPDGVNMTWLWQNLEVNTKVLIWEDYKGRQLAIPSDDTPLYYNPNGGQYYHSVADCPDVKADFLPLTAFTYGQLDDPQFASLEPCPACAPPMRKSDIEAINAAHAE